MSASTTDRTYVETLSGGRPQIHVEAHAQDFSARTRMDGGVQVVVVRGELDMATAPLLRSVLGRLHDRRSGRVELDLSGVTFLDAYALAVLRLAVCSPAGRNLTVRDPSPAVRQVVALTGLERDLKIDAGRPGRGIRRVG